MKFSTRMKGRIPEKVVEYLLCDKNSIDLVADVATGGAPENAIENTNTLVGGGNVLGGESLEGKSICEVEIAPRLLQTENFYTIGSCQSKTVIFN